MKRHLKYLEKVLDKHFSQSEGTGEWRMNPFLTMCGQSTDITTFIHSVDYFR